MSRRTVRLRSILVLAAFAATAIIAVGAWLTVGSAVERTVAGLLPPDEAAAAAAAARRAVLVVVAATLAVLLVLATWTARRITRSIARLGDSAGRVAEGRDSAMAGSMIAELDSLAGALDHLMRTHRREREALAAERDELAHLIDGAAEGILQVGPEGRVLRVNQAARRLLGLPEHAVGAPVATLVRSGELRDAIQAAGLGRSVMPFETSFAGRRILVAVRPLDAPGSAERRGAAAILVDFTELRRLEDVRRDFVANASHELKTPLTSIRGYSETLLMDDLPEEVRRRFLETVRHNAERLQRIVDDLLDLSRIESGGWRPDLEPLDPVPIAEEAWRPLRERAAERGITFETGAGPRPLALADRVALAQVFSNLFDNALRYTRPGGRIRVSAHGDASAARPVSGAAVASDGAIRSGPDRLRAAPPGTPPPGAPPTPNPSVMIEVADTGIGIPRDALPRIFERFYRVDPARSRAEGGTGLGLAIVKHLVERMGGDVTAESELGRGTTIRFRLPAAAAAPAEAPAVGRGE
ncbi:MAG TPA: ATP-binding protein [Longimicrobiales bacterium]